MEIFRIQHSSDPRGQGKRRADFGHLSDLSPKRKELVNLVNTENIVLLFKPDVLVKSRHSGGNRSPENF